jgi:hypothetical protein
LLELYLNRLRPTRAIRFEKSLVARVGAWGISGQDNRSKQKGQKVAKRTKGLSLPFLLFFTLFISLSAPKNRPSE